MKLHLLLTVTVILLFVTSCENDIAVVGLSGDVALQTMEHDELEHPLFSNRPSVRPSDADLQQVAALINQ